MLLSGWVCRNGDRGDCTLVRHDSARVWVFWADSQLPIGVHYGAHIYLLGHLRTFNVGGGFHVTDACLIERSPQAIIRAVLDNFPDVVIPPRGQVIRREPPKKVM